MSFAGWYAIGPYAVRSDFPLIGLLARDEPAVVADITIHSEQRRAIDDSIGEANENSWALIVRTGEVERDGRIELWQNGPGGEFCLRFDYRNHYAHFFMSNDGRAITVSATDSVTPVHMATLLEGPILGRALRLSGRPCLHATLLEWQGRAIGFMGPSGAGKSTLATVLVAAGCALLTDDLAILERAGDGYSVHPGRARIRLWPKSASALAVDVSAATTILEGLWDANKLAVPLGPDRRGGQPIPLSMLVQLGPRSLEASEPEVLALDAAASLAAVSANLYGSIRPESAVRRHELRLAADIAARTALRRLTLPHSTDYLLAHGATLRDLLFT